jgi:hypothetical protein
VEFIKKKNLVFFYGDPEIAADSEGKDLWCFPVEPYSFIFSPSFCNLDTGIPQ